MKVALLFVIGLALVAAQAQTEQKPAGPAVQQPAAPAVQQPTAQPSASQQTQPSATAKPRSIPLRELQDLKFIPHAGTVRGSVATATDTLFRSFLAREPATAGLFITPQTTIVYKSLLPAGGVYKGMIGLLDFMYKSKLTFDKSKFEYTIGPIDEARGISLVKMKYGGKFIRSGKPLDTTASVYICWRLGKIDKVLIVDDNAKAVYSAYETAAERVVADFWTASLSCEAGSECPEASKYLADNVKHTVSMFPEAIAKRLSYEGIEGFKKLSASPDSKWMLDRITNIRPVYGDNSTVISAIALGRGSDALRAAFSAKHGMGVNLNDLPGAGLDVDSLADLHIIDVAKVQDGKIVSCDKQLSQPIMPWHLRTLGLLGLHSATPAEIKPVVTKNATTEQKPAAPAAEQKPAEQKKA